MSRLIIPCLVKLSRPSVIELNVQLFLEGKSRRQEQKLQSLTKYIQRYPSGWKKRLELADLLYEKGDWEQAITQYYQVIERQPQLVNVRLKLGKILELATRKQEVIAIYQQTIPLCSNLATKIHIRGLIALCQGELQPAIEDFKLATVTEPKNLAHWLILGRVLMTIKNVLAALSAFEQILLLKPDDLIALIHSYDALLVLGKFPEAQRRLNRAEELAPNDYTVLKRRLAARLQRKLVLNEEGKQTKKMITTLLKLAPHSADAHQLKANYYHLRGDKAKTIAIWQQFTQKHLHNPQGWHYYAQYLFQIGENQTANQAMLQANNLLQILKNRQIQNNR